MASLTPLQNRAGNIIMVPLDHGMSMGPIEGLGDPGPLIQEVVAGGATCLTMHRGLLRAAEAVADQAAVLLHLSASTDLGPDPTEKRLVATVEEAQARGLAGVSIHINLGAPSEPRMLEDAGRVAGACYALDMPLVAMVYPRGPGIDAADPENIAHAARLGAELGADAVKVPHPGSAEACRRVVSGAIVPVLIAGGARRDTERLLADLRLAREAGARGVSIGRNIFQADNPSQAVKQIAGVFS